MTPIANIQYTTAQSRQDLEGILELQKANLLKNLSPEEAAQNGFVTIDHSYDQLERLNQKAPHIVARHEGRVVGYVLAMTSDFRQEFPVLEPMFNLFDGLVYKGKPVSSYIYLVAGQACVHKDYRRSGIMHECYKLYKAEYGHRYNLAITDIVSSNTASLAAHEKTGFREIAHFTGADGVDWTVVLWDWKSGL